jgi:hypothetical protein
MLLQRRQLTHQCAYNKKSYDRVHRVAHAPIARLQLSQSYCHAVVPATSSRLLLPTIQQKRSTQRNVRTQAFEPGAALAVTLFFTPSIVALIYAYFKGKGNVKDGLSRMLTEFSQGYFQPDVGGKNIPVALGELSDLAGDEPLFKALYQW